MSSEDEMFEIMKNMSDMELSSLRSTSKNYRDLVDKFYCIFALNDTKGTNCYSRYRNLKIRAHTIVMMDYIRNGELPNTYGMNIGNLHRDINVFKMPVNLDYVDGKSILLEIIRYLGPKREKFGEYFNTILNNPYNIGSISNLSPYHQDIIKEWTRSNMWYLPYRPIYNDL